MEQIVRADMAAFGQGKVGDGQCDDRGKRRADRRGSPARARRRRQSERPLRADVTRHVFDDGWESLEELPPFKTEVQVEKPRTDHHAATSRPTFPSTARSIRIAAASTAASIASRGRRTPIWACRRGWISNRSCSPSRTPPSCWRRSWPRTATSRARSPSAPTPIPTSRSRSSTASCARSSKCWKPAAIRSASSPNRRW